MSPGLRGHTINPVNLRVEFLLCSGGNKYFILRVINMTICPGANTLGNLKNYILSGWGINFL